MGFTDRLRSFALGDSVGTTPTQIIPNSSNIDVLDGSVVVPHRSGYVDNKAWECALKANLEFLMTVEVMEPKDSFSSHKEPFTGIVMEARADCVSVRSFDDKLFNIEFDEISSFSKV